ncbi:hypothetical protein MPTK1_1g06140 [Marchantia polymorpha subsp. ruderalis]|uniref:F-box domain-containing protein n=4 Tax=Marchantia polymorpha TaxID=3197 RepID=A0AAF6AM21_MARPO|nr:hypothetical protein MARPO_0043s0006 [Marchantia polymorpha]BBM97491.1 hypothetical protein Mp_1g06140 [Marchantia polymorpha subsp. ruderalis]|eukprot:PTQ39730.1 hypothetical protein MARPO_0043s0006 [Marchantia polymorpha]
MSVKEGGKGRHLPGLSDDILASILSFLPWYEVLRLRIVCQKWNTLLRTTGFRRKWRGRNSHQAPLCFTQFAKEHGISIYNPDNNRWQLCVMNFPSFYTFTLDDGTSFTATDVRLMGAAEGLMLLQVLVPQGLVYGEYDEPKNTHRARCMKYLLFIMNPVDASFKKQVPLLPQLRHYDTSRPMGLVWNESSHSHRIIVHHHPQSPDYTSIQEWDGPKLSTFYSYDVQSNEWDQVAKWPKERLEILQDPLLTEGGFFCLGSNPFSGLPPRFRVYSQDTSSRDETGCSPADPAESSSSSSVPFLVTDEKLHPSPPHPIFFPTLLHRQKEILVAGGRIGSHPWSDDEFPPLQGLREFCVWKLSTPAVALNASEEAEDDEKDSRVEGRTSRKKWVEICRMPDHILESLNANRLNEQFYCAVDRDFLCVASSRRNGAMFDMLNNSWSIFPPCERESLSNTAVDGQDFILMMLDMQMLDLYICEPRIDVIL